MAAKAINGSTALVFGGTAGIGYASAEEMYALPSVSMLYWNPAERPSFERQLDAEGEIHNAEVSLRPLWDAWLFSTGVPPL